MKKFQHKTPRTNRRQLYPFFRPPGRHWRCCRLGDFRCPRRRRSAGKRTAATDDTGQDRHQTQPAGFGPAATADGSKPPRSGWFQQTHPLRYDQGITYIDTAESYRTFEWIVTRSRVAARKTFYSVQVDGKPADVLAVIDHHRKVFNTDYIDSLLVHCMTRGQWTDEWKRIMDVSAGQEKKWIRAKGVSCHSLPALRATTASDWAECSWPRESAGHLHRMARWADWSTTFIMTLHR